MLRQFGRMLALMLCLLLWLGSTPALASVHEYQEGADQTMERSLQRLRDGGDRSWQLVLFKREKAGQPSIHLRLVGFPGAVNLDHAQDLQILANDATVLRAPEVKEDAPSAPHIAEYDVQAIMPEVLAARSVQVQPPLQGENTAIVVPPFVLKEWRRLLNG